MQFSTAITSKTLWGFALSAVIAVSQYAQIVPDDNLVANILKMITALFGVYGLRDAIGKSVKVKTAVTSK